MYPTQYDDPESPISNYLPFGGVNSSQLEIGGAEYYDDSEIYTSSPTPQERCRPGNAQRSSQYGYSDPGRQIVPSIYDEESSFDYPEHLPPANYGSAHNSAVQPMQPPASYSSAHGARNVTAEYTQYDEDRYPGSSSSYPRGNFDQEPDYPPPQGNSTRLIPVSTLRKHIFIAGEFRIIYALEIADMYRSLFKFGVFNAVQSSCFDHVVNENDNIVLSAPTGSGKTVIFELAIIRMLTKARETNPLAKCVYMSPTKALCSERFRDWSTKFDPLGIKCCELTGDTVQFGKGVWGDAKNAAIIITTVPIFFFARACAHWGSARKMGQSDEKLGHGQTLSTIQLFLVDEVHILNEPRGSTLEVVVSRMKRNGTEVRFLLVSATVPNIRDIASWIGNSRRDGPSLCFEFGEEFRPCKLTRHIYGIQRGQSQNEFSFNKILDFRLFSLIQKHAVDKPILVFCSTRSGILSHAVDPSEH
ncbi:ATP-dependent DNA helicase MER3 [Pleurotus ostreatus]|nr:ATP-dependent DNA helicase MER3 [Pleurotus ostreatus]